jgi:hypothetical protein
MHQACYLNRKLTKKKSDEVLPEYGWIIHWPERQGELVPVTCGVCKQRHTVKAAALRRAKAKGLHAECYAKARARAGDVPVGSEGSIFHPKMPDPSDPSKRGVTCGRCGKLWYATPR